MTVLGFDELDRLRAYAEAQGRDLETMPPDLSKQTLTSLLEHLRRHPLFARYLAHLGPPAGAAPPRNTEPWHARGEQIYAATLAVLGGLDAPGITLDFRGWASASEQIRMAWACKLAFEILLAQPYLWSDRVQSIVLAAPVPKHVVSRTLLPYPMMFFSRETAATSYDTTSGQPAGTTSNWLLLSDQGTSFALTADRSAGQACTITRAGCDYGRTYPTDMAAPEAAALRPILASLAFIASPFVESRPSRLPRPMRRELAKRGVGPEELAREIYVVVLRRAAQERLEAESEAREVAWKHRWWVSGHLRAQWYASEQAHKLVWIAPYLKGPDDKPILDKVYSVIR